MSGHIDWDHPPSTRVRERATGPRLLGDLTVLLACGIILRVLAGALSGAEDANSRGVRLYLVELLGGSSAILWAVGGAVALAALYALVDGWRTLRAGMRARVQPSSEAGDVDGLPPRRREDRPTDHAERDPE